MTLARVEPVTDRSHSPATDTSWHLVAVASRPQALICPECWPSYQDAFFHSAQPQRRHALTVIKRIRPVGHSYTCTHCERSNQ